MNVIYLKYKNTKRLAVTRNSRDYSVLDTEKSLYTLVLDSLNKDELLEEFINKIPILDVIKKDDSIDFLFPISSENALNTIVSGTGLTHKNSVMTSDSMKLNKDLNEAERIYLDGLNEGKPNEGNIGANPEWFFKGFGDQLYTSGDTLNVPPYALGAGEEAEIAAIYVIDAKGNPCRVGFALGNEFSDHVIEKRNTYYLAQSKLLPCSIGPEVFIGEFPAEIFGKIKILRKNKIIWEEDFKTGSKYMTHSLENIEHHVFKHEIFRKPGGVHVLYLGADQFSFRDGIEFCSEDKIDISANIFKFPLVNKVFVNSKQKHFSVKKI